jgi:hypothetical protein
MQTTVNSVYPTLEERHMTQRKERHSRTTAIAITIAPLLIPRVQAHMAASAVTHVP